MSSLGSADLIRHGEIVLDRESHRVSVRGDRVDLTPMEYRLLEALMEQAGVVQSRRQLLEVAWNTSARIETRTVDMHVARLRAKLGNPSTSIETVRGVGYRLGSVADGRG